jgi:hypothetical protein
MINIHVNYQKRKNQELFKSLEQKESLFLSKTQNYIPIYKRFFNLNEKNFNHVNLNHPLYLDSVSSSIKEDKREDKDKREEELKEFSGNILNGTIKNITNEKTKELPIFFKLAPLLDPFKYLVGKYNITDEKIFSLPNLLSNEDNTHPKILDINNSAYVDGLFLFLSSQLLHQYSFTHGIDYYGSFLSIKNNYKLNVFDDLEYLMDSDFFNKNKNILFQIDEFQHLFSNENEKNKLKPITIQHNISVKSNISIESVPTDLFENIFEKERERHQEESLEKDFLFLNEIHHLPIDENDKINTTTLKSNYSGSGSGSSCSSRTSRTSLNEEINNDINSLNSLHNENENENDSLDSNESVWEDEEGEEGEEEEGEEDKEEEEIIEATIPKFPVQVICMEYCENTLDDLILKNDLSKEEWFSAFMQIIMILITYQKAFAFTHNDLHTNNVMYNSTKKKFLYYKYKNIVYKVPTFGRIYKIIDFGRSIYKFQGQLFCSDSFQTGGDAATQYNTEPYLNINKPRIEPNYSFDLCRLACSIYDYLVVSEEDEDESSESNNLNQVKELIIEWCLDDKGINMLYKNNGSDRYPDFKLYKMIARHVHKHTPQAQLERLVFKEFIYNKNIDKSIDKIMDLDEIPIFI